MGNDLQANYHQQKMRDAHYMANAKVLATQLGNARAFSSPKGYFNLPPPVLGQRRFANQSQGAVTTSSGRLDVPGLAPWSELPNDNPYVSKFGRGHGYCPVDAKMKEHHLTGGVLRTTVGQDWAKAKLNDRIKQLSAIDDAKNALASSVDMRSIPSQIPFAGAEPSLDESLSLLPQVELAQLLQNVIDALMNPGDNYGAITRFVVGDANKIFALCVRLATSNSSEDIMNALEFIEGGSSQDGISQLIVDLLATLEASGYDEETGEGIVSSVHKQVAQILRTLKNLFDRLELYLKQMLKLSESPYKDRVNASKALIKSLGFLKLIKADEQLYAQVGNANREVLSSPPTINPSTGRPYQTSGAFIAPNVDYFPQSHRTQDNRLPTRDGRVKNPIVRWAGEDFSDDGRGSFEKYSFTPEAPIREDTQHGYTGVGNQYFSMDYRGAFGDQSGKFINTVEAPSDEGQYNTGGREIGYLGAEDLADEGEGDDAEAEAEATLASDTSSSTPHIRSVRDATTGEYDISSRGPTPANSSRGSAPANSVASDAPPPPRYRRVRPPPAEGRPPSSKSSAKSSAKSSDKSSAKSAPPPAPARPTYPYGYRDIPTERVQLISFIEALNARPDYSQRVNNKPTSQTANIRKNTISKMVKAGLLPP